MRRFSFLFLFIIASFSFIVSCSEVELNFDKPNEKISLTSYANDVGFNLDSPTTNQVEANTVVSIEGSLANPIGIDFEHVWVIITSESNLSEIEETDFNYYVPIKDGKFSEELVLHNGSGNYDITIRVPSNKKIEENMYYDAVQFEVVNLDDTINRDIEYTAFGKEHGLQLTKPEQGIEGSEQSVYVEGKLAATKTNEMVIVTVEKADESEQVILKLEEGMFSGDIPLYFGEGTHVIRIQVFNELDEYYYDSAILYAHNTLESEMEFADVVKTQAYMDRGITLHEPTVLTSKVYDDQAYHISGEVDPQAYGAEEISYVIVSVNQLDEDLESGYLIPVVDNSFEGTAYFRFGSGNYEVIISVPTIEQHDHSMFHYQGVAKINHEVIGVEDKRGLLPSRGIESDHPAIMEQAKKLTANYSSERDQAKAIYKFVAQHVAYDVKKADYDLFNIGDSALSALESGSGICQDYAFLATALLRAIGLESVYVHGDAGERHAWVEVKVDDEWLEMDPTWGAGYVQNGVFHFHYNEDYFDPDPIFFAETHTRDGTLY